MVMLPSQGDSRTKLELFISTVVKVAPGIFQSKENWFSKTENRETPVYCEVYVVAILGAAMRPAILLWPRGY